MKIVVKEGKGEEAPASLCRGLGSPQHKMKTNHQRPCYNVIDDHLLLVFEISSCYFVAQADSRE